MVTPVSGPVPLPAGANPTAIAAPQPGIREPGAAAPAEIGSGADAAEAAPGDRGIAFLQSPVHADYHDTDESTSSALLSPTHYLGTT